MTAANDQASAVSAGQRRWWPAAIAFFLPILLLVPFANKAYNIDEPVFVWVAQQIREHPLDFFGFVVDEGYKKTPMHDYNHNPPGVSYYLALISLVFGWGEVPMHLATDLVAGFGGLGVYQLARRLCSRPLLVAMLVILAPAFLVSAASVMTDVSMATIYIWAVYAWIRGLDSGDQRWLIAGAVAAAGSALCKYFGITAVPLLLAYTLVRQRALDLRAAYLLIPVGALASLQVWTWRLYGSANILDAAGVAMHEQFRVEEGVLFRPLDVLIFLGGAYAPLALLAQRVYSWKWLAGTVAVAALLATPLIEGYSVLQLLMGKPEPWSASVLTHAAVMLALGFFVVSLPIRAMIVSLDPETVLLALWLVGTLAFAMFINHFVDVRALLPALAPAAMLLERAVGSNRSKATPRALILEWWPIPLAGLFSVWLVAADYTIAENARQSVLRTLALARAEGARVSYYGMWGFQYYFQKAGASPLDVEAGGPGGGGQLKMMHGDLLAVSSEIHERLRGSAHELELVDAYTYPSRFGVATFHPVEEAGFYSHMTGVLPYAIGRLRPEEYAVYRWTGPDYVPKAANAVGFQP